MTTANPEQSAAALESWFASTQRDLPWRRAENARDPYRVLVSEVMLQQTTVAAVVPYYDRFLNRFPDVSTLARADIEEVLPLWAGLGYYARARNLHAAAKAVMEKHNGRFPETLPEVLALPGIGRYTAGAVCSIAFDQAVPIVDANVARVLARVLCIEDDVKSSKAQAQLWSHAATLVEASTHPRDFNPAMMELGALICTPKNPRCEVCPVSQSCCAFQTSRQNELPKVTPKKLTKEVHDVCLLLRHEGGILLRRRTAEDTDKNWWRGMWELPRTTRRPHESTCDALQRLLDDLEIEATVEAKVQTLKHSVTVHRITLECFEATLQDAAAVKPSADLRFFREDEWEPLALPSTMRKLLCWLQTHHFENKQGTLL